MVHGYRHLLICAFVSVFVVRPPCLDGVVLVGNRGRGGVDLGSYPVIIGPLSVCVWSNDVLQWSRPLQSLRVMTTTG